MNDVILIDNKAKETTISLSKNESKTIVILINNATTKLDLRVELNGEGAHANILGIVIGNDNQEYNLNTYQIHKAAHTTSDLLVKGVFDGSSKLKYRGLIEIAKNAQNANAFQQENNLILSPLVNIDTRPELEIEANEVRCTHAATIGQINEEELFYLKSRGLSQKKAESLIVAGFLQQVVQRIPEGSVRNKISNDIY
ncbi:MAG: SufD family Fe-S cluster assembly protein [bacterium]|nr:SufD family Fe-S cluster assembly protein [bacterium]